MDIGTSDGSTKGSGCELSVTRHLEKAHDPADIMWVELERHQKSDMLSYFHNAAKRKGIGNT